MIHIKIDTRLPFVPPTTRRNLRFLLFMIHHNGLSLSDLLRKADIPRPSFYKVIKGKSSLIQAEEITQKLMNLIPQHNYIYVKQANEILDKAEEVSGKVDLKSHGNKAIISER
ncbi:hypothetical protein BCE33L4227 [Bacillus cereus E33L]|uniref:Uncharacterized protein n=1 Tax=Bacillus cereus (strain ZK / E33L) TaxID=288681 RepID=Q633W1_BACCZ|nr:hypothetical protein BCE33L4227 [Bacillus cereus E33L]